MGAADGPRRIAVFGGIYSNHLALRAAVEDARARGAGELYCLGDLGAFGPNPDRVFPLLLEHDVKVVRGNYDDSISRGLEDCQCGYTDPRDNHFASLSYRYTYRNTSERWRRWMGDLPAARRLELAEHELLMCHGSPRRMNEFLWESTSSTQFLAYLAREHGADVVLVTHTGIPWIRELPDGGLFVNVGALGRPANDGHTEVWYALLSVEPPPSPEDEAGPGDAGAPRAGPGGATRGGSGPDDRCPRGPPVSPPRPEAPCASGPVGRTRPGAGPQLRAELVPVSYEHHRLAAEMREEALPEEFAETIVTGWWTTCLEVLPARERKRGRY